jgi:cystinosin
LIFGNTNFAKNYVVLKITEFIFYSLLIFQYSPQVWLNFKRKSTEGFHIGGVLLDFGGGVLSLLQMDLYCFIEHSNKQLTGNIPKMALPLFCIFIMHGRQ